MLFLPSKEGFPKGAGPRCQEHERNGIGTMASCKKKKMKSGEDMQAVYMYNHLRKYLSPVTSYDLVKDRFPKINFSMIELEVRRLKLRF